MSSMDLNRKLITYLVLGHCFIIAISNYLVQFPIKIFGMQEILTYGAISYPVTFLITDLANRKFGKLTARKIVYLGFVIGIFLTLFFSLKKGKNYYEEFLCQLLRYK